VIFILYKTADMTKKSLITKLLAEALNPKKMEVDVPDYVEKELKKRGLHLQNLFKRDFPRKQLSQKTQDWIKDHFIPKMRNLKEFTPNPAETPEIYYGNEKRRYFKQPSFDNQDMNAIKSTHPIAEEVCTDCGEEMVNGKCAQCGDVWGKPDSGHQATMARAELKDLISNASKLYSMVEPGTELPGWVAAYITLASDYMHSVAEYASEVA